LIGYSLGRINPEQSHLGASLPNRFFAAVITATLKEKCDIELMSPIFRCLGCGQYIERSLEIYKKRKVQIFCSTCNHRKQIDSATGSNKT
jgi:Zn finger protein HypA/HybF involved in hydrogenase expression